MENKKEEVKTQKQKMFPGEMKVFIQKDGEMFPFPLTMKQLANCRKVWEKEEKFKSEDSENKKSLS